METCLVQQLGVTWNVYDFGFNFLSIFFNNFFKLLWRSLSTRWFSNMNRPGLKLNCSNAAISLKQNHLVYNVIQISFNLLPFTDFSTWRLSLTSQLSSTSTFSFHEKKRKKSLNSQPFFSLSLIFDFQQSCKIVMTFSLSWTLLLSLIWEAW
jgi:hypothetical protein